MLLVLETAVLCDINILLYINNWHGGGVVCCSSCSNVCSTSHRLISSKTACDDDKKQRFGHRSCAILDIQLMRIDELNHIDYSPLPCPSSFIFDIALLLKS
jgi:hypothetical protein